MALLKYIARKIDSCSCLDAQLSKREVHPGLCKLETAQTWYRKSIGIKNVLYSARHDNAVAFTRENFPRKVDIFMHINGGVGKWGLAYKFRILRNTPERSTENDLWLLLSGKQHFYRSFWRMVFVHNVRDRFFSLTRFVAGRSQLLLQLPPHHNSRRISLGKRRFREVLPWICIWMQFKNISPKRRWRHN